jgi:acetate kinase
MRTLIERKVFPIDSRKKIGAVLIVTVNAGSASAKLAAYELRADALQRVAYVNQRGSDTDPRDVLKNFSAGLKAVDVECVAHRVVHGGTRLARPVRIDSAVEAEIELLGELAPLHNPVGLRWIRAARSVFPAEVTHVAAFDTAFFSRMPRVAAEYAIAPALTAAGVKRYGFHGLAHQAMWQRWCELRPDLEQGGRLITLQLGGGTSAAAILRGAPIDTSMGFSPLEGLVMRTRSGDVDAAIIPYLARQNGWTAERVVDLLNRESGLEGLAGKARDLSALIESAAPEDQFAVDLYCYRASKRVGAYMVALGGCDGICFGGGVSEHVPEIRARIIAALKWAGIVLDARENARAKEVEARISADTSTAGILVIRVDEEKQLARAALAVTRSP